MSALRLAAKDLTLELRERELLDASLLGALAVVVVAGVAFAALPERPERTAAVLWVGVVVASLLPLARSFTGEADRGTMDVLLLLPVERGAVLFGKVLSNLALTLAGALVVLAGYVGLFGATPAVGWGLAALLALGALGVSAAGSVLAAIAAQTRGREALLPVLLFPLLLPVLLSAVPGSIHALHGDAWPTYAGELQLLLGYDAVVLAATWLLSDAVLEG